MRRALVSHLVVSALAVGWFIFGAPLPGLCLDSKLAAVKSEPLPAVPTSRSAGTNIQGVLFGKPFKAEEALINSFSLTFRQKHKQYARVVLNFAQMQTKLPEKEFFSEGRVQPHVDIALRTKNGEKLRSQSYLSGGDDYFLHVKFGQRLRDGKRIEDGGYDTTVGAVILRFKNGDYVKGTFAAQQSIRIIWDDEAVE
jgi:hypothetical protein